ncbi:MAG TPA: hypothetical protein VFT72_11560 [Opitutaceae bacterium]|nr:hypothetical protein [Opitutaceae bacterium]
MKSLLPRVLLLSLIGTTGTAFAQTDLSFIFTRRPKNTFSASLNIRPSSSKVSFTGLGTISSPILDPVSGTRTYDDGVVGLDSKTLRADEAGKTPVNGRYQSTDANLNVPADYLAYQDGKTRYWTYDSSETQASDGAIFMHRSETVSTGGSAEADGGASAGFDLQFGREIGRIGKRGSWGLVASVGLGEINGQVSKTITADLVTTTDRYDLFGQTAPASPDASLAVYTAPHVVTNYDGDKVVSVTEDTVAISQNPTSSTTTTVANGAQINGTWQLKSAYYIVRLGPQFRYQFSNRFSVSLTAGPAAAIAGSTFRTDMLITSPTLKYNALQTENRERFFKIGAYAEINAEFWFTFRTGIFAGAVYERLGKFDQQWANQNAHVEIGKGTSFRLGMITRF